MEIKISTETNDAARVLEQIAGHRVAAVLARVANTLAFGARPAVVSELARTMQLRNRFSAAGIQVDQATDAQPAARIGIEERRSYLVDHVTGATRKGRGGHGRGIPDPSLIPASGRIPRGKRPKALVGRAKAAETRAATRTRVRGRKAAPAPFLERRGGIEYLLQRTGSESDAPLMILYAFRPTVKVRAEFDLPRTVADYVGAHWSRVLSSTLDREIARARRG